VSDAADEEERRERFEEQYGPVRSEGSRLVEVRALGRDLGSNGYATFDEAHALVDLLRPSRPRMLLDLGSGRGWPGVLVGEELDCRLVASDIPRNALIDARASMRSRGLAGGVTVADGRWLPFASTSFGGIIHADVFC
jgi:methylase of polypeptide subunit release factors